jgi:hypothetical protein
MFDHMNYFVITYRVLVDNALTIVGTTGNVVFGEKNSVDYKPSTVGKYLMEAYRTQYPDANHITVLFQDIHPVSEQYYDKVSGTFTLPQPMAKQAG